MVDFLDLVFFPTYRDPDAHRVYRAGLGPPILLKRVQNLSIFEFRQNYLSERDLYSAFKVLTPTREARSIIAWVGTVCQPLFAVFDSADHELNADRAVWHQTLVYISSGKPGAPNDRRLG
jgi:hypothetical protein